MSPFLRIAAFCAAVVFAGSAAGAQSVSPEPATGVTIAGSVPQPVTLSAADIAALPHEHVDVIDDDKTKASYDGVELHLLLERAGMQFGEAVRGPRLLDYAVVTAADGYHALFAVAELDPAFVDRKIILADRRNGAPLDAKHGPFRLVVPDEFRHARWVRQVMSLSIARASVP